MSASGKYIQLKGWGLGKHVHLKGWGLGVGIRGRGECHTLVHTINTNEEFRYIYLTGICCRLGPCKIMKRNSMIKVDGKGISKKSNMFIAFPIVQRERGFEVFRYNSFLLIKIKGIFKT